MRKHVWVWLALVLIETCAAAQTVTGSGTAGTVPVFTGSGTTSTIGTPSSPITVTSTGNVGIGTAAPLATLDINGGLFVRGYVTTGTGGTYANQWTELGQCTVTAQYSGCNAIIQIIGGVANGNNNGDSSAKVNWRVKQQAALGSDPYVEVDVGEMTGGYLQPLQFVAVTTTTSTSQTIVQLWAQITEAWEAYNFTPTIVESSSIGQLSFLSSQGFSSSLPSGTQSIGTVVGNVAGSATAPSITFDGNTGTGIFSPGSNALGISTNGVERLRVDTSGNVGIGTTSPAHRLQVEEDDNSDAAMISVVNSYAQQGTQAFSRVSVGMTPSTGVAYGDLSYFNSNYPASGIYVPRRTVVEGNDAGGLFLAADNPSGVLGFATGGSGTERMRVDQNGNLGIGTTNPLSLLSVGSSSQFQVNSSGVVTAPSVTASGAVTAQSFSGSGAGLTGIPYAAITGAPASTVTSFSGRTGAVVPASGDYSVGQIIGAAPAASPSFTGNVGIGNTSPTGGSLVLGNQTVARNLRIAPYAYFGSSYSAWDTIIGSNVRAREGTTNPGYELGSSVTGSGASMFLNNFGLNSGLYQWKASDISGYTEGQALTLPAPTIYFDSNRNVGIGTNNPQAKLEINGNLRFSTDGSVQTTAWTGVLCGGDYAEAVDPADAKEAYGPGDVLVITEGEKGDIQKSSQPYATTVAGVFATKPGVVGRRQTLPDTGAEIPMAMVGIVPTKVTAENGPIRRGDLLVTSSQSGFAMKGTDRNRMLGAVIGKAMGSLDSGSGTIEVLVTLQ